MSNPQTIPGLLRARSLIAELLEEVRACCGNASTEAAPYKAALDRIETAIVDAGGNALEF